MSEPCHKRAPVIVFGLLSALSVAACEPRPGTLREQVEHANERVRVRIEVFDEGNPAHVFDRGCHVRLSSAPVGTDQWRQFGNAYFGRCDYDFTGRVQFVNRDVAYVYLQWWYAVTVNGGERWSTWDVPAHAAGRVFYNNTLIEKVSIQPDGTGTMTLNPQGVVEKRRLTLHTKDFGQQWFLE